MQSRKLLHLIEPEYFLRTKNNTLTKNMLNTQIKVGVVRKFHLLLIKTNPKCEICVTANAELSTIDAFFSPIDFAKLE